jgi:hypothetical protein
MKNKALTLVCVSSFAALALAAPLSSGLNKGEYVSPFHPQHVSGPDKGTDTCPPCKYGNLPAVQVWFGGSEDTNNIMALAKVVDGAVAKNPENLKGFMIRVANCDTCTNMAKMMGTDAEKKGMKNVAIAYVKADNEAIKNYKINLDAKVKNTVLVYKDRQVVAKFVNLKADAAGKKALEAALASVAK